MGFGLYQIIFQLYVLHQMFLTFITHLTKRDHGDFQSRWWSMYMLCSFLLMTTFRITTKLQNNLH